MLMRVLSKIRKTFCSGNQSKKTVRILSIDGGGIPGIIPLILLRQIQRRTKHPISQQFDIIAGTSSGGIIALGLGSHKVLDAKKPLFQSEDLLSLYKKMGERIFQNSGFWSGWTEALKQKKKLETILIQSGFSNQKLSGSLTTLLVPAFSLQKRIHKIFSSYNSNATEDYFIIDAALATSDAPTFFDPHKVFPVLQNADQKNYKTIDKHNFENCVDGLAINNPTLLSFIEARSIFPEANDFFIVSLGTGKLLDLTGEDLSRDKGKMDVYRNFRLMSESQRKAFEQISGKLFKVDQQGGIQVRYTRLQTTLDPKIAQLDNVKDGSIRYLEGKGLELIQKTDNQLNQIISELKKERKYLGEQITVLKPGHHFSKKQRDPHDIQMDLDKALAERDELRKELINKQLNFQDSTQKLKIIRDKIEQTINKNKNLISERDGMKKELQSIKNTNHILKKQKDDLRADLARKHQTENEKNQIIETVKSKSQIHQKKVSELENTIWDFKKEVTELKNQITELKEIKRKKSFLQADLKTLLKRPVLLSFLSSVSSQQIKQIISQYQ